MRNLIMRTGVLLTIKRSLALSARRLPSPSSVAPSEAIARRGRECLDFIDASPTPYHCVDVVGARLAAAGFTRLDEAERWKIKPGGLYYWTRHEGTIIAIAVGKKATPEKTAFKLLGGHTDSPVLKVRPVAARADAAAKNKTTALEQVGVECYGGGLWHTWLDRDLGVAGRVVVRRADGSFDQVLVRDDDAICRVPTLCIHLQTADERKSLTVDKEKDLQPILCSTAVAQLSGTDIDSQEGEADAWRKKQPAPLLQRVARAAGVDVDQIVDFDLTLFDVQKGSVGGAFGEFVLSSRLDDQAACYVLTESLLAHVKHEAFSQDEDVSVVALFDHEEIGSASASGAGSPVLGDAVERVHKALRANGAEDGLDDREALALAMRRSMLLSVDQAHAVHPNYAHKHDGAHAPRMNHGLVIKTNTNQRYTTDGVTGFLLRETARRAGLPAPQEFVVRNDCPCGSTIGPILAARWGIRAADVGLPQLSMHSIREMMGVHDITLSYEFFGAFLRDFRALDDAFRKE